MDFDGIEKLINEQGRIGLTDDNCKALEGKLLEAEARAEAAELDKKKLDLEVSKLRDRVRELEDKITGNHSGCMEDVKEKILQVLAKRPDLETEAVAAVLNIGPEVAAFHLKELENKKFAYGAYTYGMIEPATWFLLQDGKHYLIAHGLIE